MTSPSMGERTTMSPDLTLPALMPSDLRSLVIFILPRISELAAGRAQRMRSGPASSSLLRMQVLEGAPDQEVADHQLPTLVEHVEHEGLDAAVGGGETPIKREASKARR